MSISWRWIFFILSLGFLFSDTAFAWGRHDLMTQIALDSPEFAPLKAVHVIPEPIEKAAPDLLKRVIPDLEKWCERYHKEHDTRYDWKAPEAADPKRSSREALLWALEDNMDTPLDTGPEDNAAAILVGYVDEPDGAMDTGLNRSPYVERLRSSMSYFYIANDEHTHAFRHYYVPTSLLPPITSPKGIAPYRADLYAQLAKGAFDTGHPYWGYRFMAWSLHYLQDVTQPWHTVFLPGLSFLSFSKSKMKHEVSALHYLTEAFADSWIIQMFEKRPGASGLQLTSGRSLAEYRENTSPMLLKLRDLAQGDPWYVSALTERLARSSHNRAYEVANQARSFFAPIMKRLGPDLKATTPTIKMGGLHLASYMLDFDGNGAGATQFLSPLLHADFRLGQARDRLLKELVEQINAAIGGSRLLIAHVLGEAQSSNLGRPRFSALDGTMVLNPT